MTTSRRTLAAQTKWNLPSAYPIDNPHLENLAAFAKDALDQAATLPDGVERDELLKKARRADVAAHIDEWANSTGLQAPK